MIRFGIRGFVYTILGAISGALVGAAYAFSISERTGE